MNGRSQDLQRLDLPRLAEAGAELNGELAPQALSRLADDARLLAPANWQAQAELRREGGTWQTWLHLQAQAPVSLVCQRCLQPLAHTLVVEQSMRFVADEGEAERLDEESDEDVLALPRTGLDLPALVEDELILALPLVPRHETCPSPLPAAASEPTAATPQRPSPFAALAALKRPKGQDGGDDSEPQD